MHIDLLHNVFTLHTPQRSPHVLNPAVAASIYKTHSYIHHHGLVALAGRPARWAAEKYTAYLEAQMFLTLATYTFKVPAFYYKEKC